MPARQQSPFKESNVSKVWLAVIQRLEQNQPLRAGVKTWQVWNGSEEDTSELSDTDLPALRLTPQSAAGEWLDEATHQYTLLIKFDLGVLGTDVTDIMDFWDAVRAALYDDTGNTFLNQLVPYGVIQKTITAPAFEPKSFGGASGLAAVAQFRIKMRVTT